MRHSAGSGFHRCRKYPSGVVCCDEARRYSSSPSWTVSGSAGQGLCRQTALLPSSARTVASDVTDSLCCAFTDSQGTSQRVFLVGGIARLSHSRYLVLVCRTRPTFEKRVLGAHTLTDGQNSPRCFAGFLKLSPVFLMVFPGVIGYVLWQKGAIHLADVPGTGRPDYNTMLPLLIRYLIPVGVRGLIAASLAAALMSCMAAALNSCATLISIDVAKRLKPQATDAYVVRVGRITTCGHGAGDVDGRPRSMISEPSRRSTRSR